MPDICLVSMPYDALEQPSIALGLLTASAKNKGLNVKSLYPKFWLAELIGFQHYNMVTGLEQTTNFIAEWIFARSAFPDFNTDAEQYLFRKKDLLDASSKDGTEMRELCLELRDNADEFVDTTARRILSHKPRIVGCTSSFRQHCSSLAVLRRIRDIDPDVITMLGGCNCEGLMGLTTKRCFPWVDFVVSGEADHVFPELCRLLLEQGRRLDASKLPMGVISDVNLHSLSRQGEDCYRAMVSDLDTLPVPDYSGFFEEYRKFPKKGILYPFLSVETSRGCWWGQKRPCTFCGLNGTSHQFRVKSPDKIIAELDDLDKRYETKCYLMTDNILHMAHFKTVLPRLASRARPSFFIQWEVKSNLRENHVRMLARAGIRQVQAGIENLDDGALKLLNKGVTSIQNVAILKYSMENGIRVFWNYLTGIPGEDDSWYAAIADWLPMVFHLQPPVHTGDIRYDRFSQYFRFANRYNLNLNPFWEYFSLYPLSEKDMHSMAYFFENTNGHPARRPGKKKLNSAIEQWQKLFEKHHSIKEKIVLSVSESDDTSLITDTRPCSLERSVKLNGLLHAVHRLCATPCSRDALFERLAEGSRKGLRRESVDEAIAELRDRKLVLAPGNKVLSLALREPVKPLLTLKEFFRADVLFTGLLDSFLHQAPNNGGGA